MTVKETASGFDRSYMVYCIRAGGAFMGTGGKGEVVVVSVDPKSEQLMVNGEPADAGSEAGDSAAVAIGSALEPV